jgi:UDP-4-amino-4,6-dideoxy-N-acetyl-beta-L-altrosamine N-acetyltransferase
MYEFGGVAIRPIEEKDLEKMASLRGDPRIWIMLGDISMINKSAQQHWFSSLQSDPKRSYFILCSKQQDFLGIVRMDEIDWISKSMRVGGDILPEFHHQGHGTKMFEIIKKYCFDYLNMNRLWLFVLDTNSAALRLYAKAGFKEEGRQRQAIFRDGRYHDYIMMSLLQSERCPDQR